MIAWHLLLCLLQVIPENTTNNWGGSKLVLPQPMKVTVSSGYFFRICDPIAWNTASWIVVFMLSFFLSLFGGFGFCLFLPFDGCFPTKNKINCW